MSNLKHLKYILGILNSDPYRYLIRLSSPKTGEDGCELLKDYIESMRIPPPLSVDKRLYNCIVNTVNDLIEMIKKKEEVNKKELEDKLNRTVYKLYDLNNEEIKVIKNELIYILG